MWKRNLMLFILWVFLAFVPPGLLGLWLDKVDAGFWLAPVVIIISMYWAKAVADLIRSLK